MRMMKASNSVLSAVIVSVLGLSATLNAPHALAYDAKNYAGYMCKQYAGTGWVGDGYSSIYNGANGSVSPTAWVYLDCPVVKNAKDYGIEKAWVRAVDRHYNEDIVCTLYSTRRRDSDDALIFNTYGPIATAGSGNNVQTLNFGWVGGYGMPGLGHYYLACAIPPTYQGNPYNASAIHTYQIQ